MNPYTLAVTLIKPKMVQDPYVSGGLVADWNDPIKTTLGRKAYLDIVNSIEAGNNTRQYLETSYRLVFEPGGLENDITVSARLEVESLNGTWDVFGYPEHYLVGIVHTEVAIKRRDG